ncbi:MAG: hypothetical protein HOV80_05510 [Polyangiaceae bacterium]|nr:hypothetical protein [Polyangiaceae bacterium]
MRLPMRAYAAFLAFLLTVVVGLPAFAQKITVAAAQVDRDGPGHDQPGFELFVSRSDCESPELFTFPFAISDVSGADVVEVWLADKSSIDCKSIEARNENSTGTHCVRLATADAAATGDILIPSADIANAISGVDECIDTASGGVPHHVTLYFLIIRAPGDAVPNEDAATFETDVDLLGPAPPTDVVAKSGAGSVTLEFTADDAEDLRGYFVYCAPPGGGGLSGCESSSLQSGQPPPGPELRCAPAEGDDPISATNALTVRDLAIGERVGMAIVAVDALGNPGVLSNVVCGEPQPVEDEGACSAAPHGPGAAGSIALGALALAAAGGLVLRRRRRLTCA